MVKTRTKRNIKKGKREKNDIEVPKKNMVFNIEIFNSTKTILLLLGIAVCLLVGMAAGAIFCCYWNSFGKKKNETTPGVSCFMGLSVVPPLGEREEATGDCECECDCDVV